MFIESLIVKLQYLLSTIKSLPYLFRHRLFPEQKIKKELRNKGRFSFYYRKNTVDQVQLLHSLSLYFIKEYKPKIDDVVIDVGAHIGTFTIPIAAKVLDGRVYSIEASVETYSYLLNNVKLNKLKNVVCFHLALSDRNGKVQLYHSTNENNWSNSITHKHKGEREIVNSMTLQSFLSNNEINHCNFIKFNCEGAEFPIILSTSVETLQKIDLFLILYHLDYGEGFRKEDLIQHFETAGFSCRLINEKSQRGWLIARRNGTR